MNCFRQANIRMQCKVYDSLLFLPPDLQAARGLMCCSVALSALGLLVAVAGMRCTSCLKGSEWAKTIILIAAGAMQFMACICVFIPVSWTGHVIIRDFYNPLLIDAQRRELGEALYIGWVTGALLFASALLFICRRVPSDKGSFDVYHPVNPLGYKMVPNKPALTRYDPISTLSSLQSTRHHNSLQNNGSTSQQFVMPLQNVPQVMTNSGAMINPSVVYNPGLPEKVSFLHQGSTAYRSSLRSSNPAGSLYTPGNSLYISQNTTPYTMTPYYAGNPASYQSSFHPVPQTPIFVTYKESRVYPESHSGSSAGVYI